VTTCEECGVTSQGAIIVETDDGRKLCQNCRGTGACERCGAETDETTLSGKYRCQRCQNTIRGQDVTREDSQSDLGRWSQ